jgi:hypothetical protein
MRVVSTKRFRQQVSLLRHYRSVSIWSVTFSRLLVIIDFGTLRVLHPGCDTLLECRLKVGPR